MTWLYAICPTCGRYAQGNPDTPEASTQALTDWAAEHAPGVQQHAEQPEGWPRDVSGVRTNGHLRVVLGGKAFCSGHSHAKAPRWPCPEYVEQARNCPANGLGLAPEAPAPDGG